MNALAGDRLPGLLGHELRNPLASAMTGVMLAREMLDDGDPRAAVLDGVLQDLDRTTGLLDGWLDMARNRSVCGHFIDVCTWLGAVADRHHGDLLSCPHQVGVRASRVLLDRAVDNLCENARKAGAKSIRIAAQTDGDMVAIHFEDDGRGLAADDAERVFEAGWSAGGSSGLGLFAVAETVNSSGGSVQCVPLERGTRFTIKLPIVAQEMS